MQSATDFYEAHHGSKSFLTKEAVIDLLAKYDAHRVQEICHQAALNESYYETPRNQPKNLDVHLGI